ncbi:MAG: M28 family peptidase [Deltaproteobacteria bacterium]|nr:M28 family peptidase [Deltaproteobacteria bacterium]MBM4285770.1 M28 family peptidase [Deltaproteobacteria bacterium]
MKHRSRLFRPGRFLLALACLVSLGPEEGFAVDQEAVKKGLLEHLTYLSVTLGERSIYRPANLQAAEAYVFDTLAQMGYAPRRQSFICQGEEVSNVVAGEPRHTGYYLLGAHFDTVAGSPGADDNASGVAVLLEVARLVRGENPPRPWVFVGFTTEEPPAFFTPYMGSRVYARRAKKEGHRILGMICLESVGYFRQEPGSQSLPISLRLMGYPTTGNFIGIVSDWRSRPLMRGLEGALKAAARLPVQSLAIPLGGHLMPEVRLSDHANFWDEGYPAVMVTDTAFFRNPNYHTERDQLETLDLEAMVELTLGLAHFVRQAE